MKHSLEQIEAEVERYHVETTGGQELKELIDELVADNRKQADEIDTLKGAVDELIGYKGMYDALLNVNPYDEIARLKNRVVLLLGQLKEAIEKLP